MDRITIARLLLRLGLALVFLYASIGSFLFPNNWIGFLPTFLKEIFPPDLLLKGFGVYELMLGLWLLWGWKVFYSSALAALTTLGIIAFNLNVLDITFRDFAILLSSAALATLAYKE